MHSCRMRTVRCSSHRGVYAWQGGVCLGCVCLAGRGVCLAGWVSGYLRGAGGGVSAWQGVYTPAQNS